MSRLPHWALPVRTLPLLLGGLLLLTGCAELPTGAQTAAAPAPPPAAQAAPAAAAPAPPAPPAGPAPHGSTLLATLRTTTGIAPMPGASSSEQIPARTPLGAPTTLPVTDDQGDWLRVLLPGRPNGRAGWVRAAEVDLTATDWRLEVSLTGHTLTVFRGLMQVAQHPVGVGKSVTPTPRGTWFVTDLLRPADPDGPYGPYAFGLSARSDVLTTFAGGDGQIGLHGNDDPAGIGQDVSAGCLRLDDDVVTELARQLPLGTPVVVTA